MTSKRRNLTAATFAIIITAIMALSLNLVLAASLPPGGTPYDAGYVLINGGAASTTSTSVTLTVQAPGPPANALWVSIQISNDASFSTATTFTDWTTDIPWVLTSGSGTKTVYVKFIADNSTTSSTSNTINLVSGNTNPTISLTTPSANQTISGTGAVNISGRVTDPDSSQTITISATVAGVYKAVTFSSPASSKAWNLSWLGTELNEGSYTASITVTASDGTGSGTAAYTGDITVDKTAPTVNIPTSSGITQTGFVATGNASDANGPLQYLFNLDGIDKGTWQSSSSYIFTGLTANTTHTVKYKAKDAVGNTSAFSAAASVTTSPIQVNQNPVISISSPTTNQIYSAQTGYKTITITGKVSDPDANNVTVTASINGKSNSTTVNSAPTTPPGSSNFTLTWDVAVDGIVENTYSGISVSANDGNGGTASAVLAPTLTVDKTAPTINAPTSSSITQTGFVASGSASDANGPVKYLFNLNGTDQGTWQNGNSYTFTGLTPNTTYIVKYMAKDAVGNTSAYSTAVSVTTLPQDFAPTGSIIIDKKTDGTGQEYTNVNPLKITISVSDDNSALNNIKVFVSETNTTPSASDSGWASFPASGIYNYNYTGPDGVVRIYAWFKDEAGNISNVTSDDIIFDATPITGSFIINDGTSTSTLQALVTLHFSKDYNASTDFSDVKEIIISNSSDFSSSMRFDYSSDISWTLDTSAAGQKTVYAKFADWACNESSSMFKSINYYGQISVLGSIYHDQLIDVNGSEVELVKPNLTKDGNIIADGTSNTFVDGNTVVYVLGFSSSTPDNIKEFKADFRLNDYNVDGISIDLERVELQKYIGGVYQTIKSYDANSTKIGKNRYVVTLGKDDTSTLVPVISKNGAGNYRLLYQGKLHITSQAYNTGSDTIRNNVIIKVYTRDELNPDLIEHDSPTNKTYIVTKVAIQ